jgi:hypothetical protein
VRFSRTDSGELRIFQTSDRAVIDCGRFEVGAAVAVEVRQPSADSVAVIGVHWRRAARRRSSARSVPTA